jgi:hypothetical protein
MTSDAAWLFGLAGWRDGGFEEAGTGRRGTAKVRLANDMTKT